MTPADLGERFRNRVLEHAAALPPQQRAIADYLVDHVETVPFLSVPQLAARTGASEATVVRFAQRIGYEGFAELKVDLVEELKNRLAGAGRREAPALGGDVLSTVAALEVDNIRSSIDRIDRAVFHEIAEAVFAAEHAYTFGMGVSAYLAELAAYSLTQIGVRSVALSTRFSSPAEQLVVLQPEDLVIALSFPPYSRQTLDVLDEAASIGAATVVLCDRLTAPAARLGRWVLPIRTESMMFTNSVAAVTVAFDALAAEIATCHQVEAIAAFSRINRVLAEDPDVTQPPAVRQGGE